MVTEAQRAYSRQWYLDCREEHIAKVKARLKETNYATEKTAKQRHARSIKRQTRQKYPFKEGQRCEYCPEALATERHHTTDPITVEDFKFTCHDCHLKENLEMKTTVIIACANVSEEK